jgi:DNA helicase IV
MEGLGTLACAHKTMSGLVAIADLATFEPTPKEAEDHPGDSVTPAIVRLVGKAITDGKDVVLLSRKHSLPWYVNYGERRSTFRDSELDSFLRLVHSHLPPELGQRVTISTVHAYKGLQKKVVLVLDAVPRCYPLLHPDLIFTRVFGNSIERVVAEERRLFYVALTRAVERLFILTEKNNLSPFLEELRDSANINWSDYPPVVGLMKRITVRVGSRDGRGGQSTFAIKDLLKADGYRWITTGWKAWCRTWPAQGFSVQEFSAQALWSAHADGIEVRFYDDAENVVAICRVDRGRWSCVLDNI